MSDTYEQPEDDEPDLDIPDEDPEDAPEDDADEVDDDLEIGFDGEQSEEPDLVRHLRGTIKAQAEELKRRPVQEEPAIVVGEKPTMETCGFDEDKYEAEYDSWKDRKAKAEGQNEQRQSQARDSANLINSDLNDSLTRFGAARKALKVPNFEAAETAVNAALDENQISCLFQAIDGDSAKVIYALGRTPAKLAELAGIRNIVKFTAAVARLEGKVTVKSKKAAVEPDEPVRGSARMSASSDKELERLEKDADKSKDRTKVIAYKMAKKAREASRSKR